KAAALPPVTQGLTQRRKLHTEPALLELRTEPDAVAQLILGDRFARAVDQGDQDIERATAESNRLAFLEQQPFRRDQSKRHECEDHVIHRAHPMQSDPKTRAEE